MFALTIVCSVVSFLCVILLGLYIKSRLDLKRLRSELERFCEIVDLEKYRDDTLAKAEAVEAETAKAAAALEDLRKKMASSQQTIASQESLIAEQQDKLNQAAAKLGAYVSLDEIRLQIEKQKQKVSQYNQLLGNFKTADELNKRITDQTTQIKRLAQTIGKFDTVAKLDAHIAQQQAQVSTLRARVADLNSVLAGANTAAELQARITYQENLLTELQAKVGEVEETLAMQEFGFYRPRYDFESSSQYQLRLDAVRDRQKDLMKRDTAVKWEKQWIVEGSDAKGRKMMGEQTKLMLRAFNGECDAAVVKVKYDNANSLENRIRRSWEQINKLGKTNCAEITADFFDLKLQELYLVHEHQIKKWEKKEEQQRIKEQMREEEKVQKEIEKVQQEAEKQETLVERALEKARREFEKATQSQRDATRETEVQNAALAQQIAKLENELKEAIDRKAKAIARAQLTKSGHVYILSNIGSFGEQVYKIGMTRRLEPLERVNELGDASVPFRFDVHAMIYSENAPALENALHRHFACRRVNLVNLRREFFFVTLDEIRNAVKENFGEVTFVTVPEAAEYRETLAQRKDEETEVSVTQGPSKPRFVQPAVAGAV